MSDPLEAGIAGRLLADLRAARGEVAKVREDADTVRRWLARQLLPSQRLKVQAVASRRERMLVAVVAAQSDEIAALRAALGGTWPPTLEGT